MKQVTLKVSSREATGRSSSRRLRDADKIPAVIYGASGVRHLSVDRADFRRLMKEISGRTALVELVSEGAESSLSIIQETQRDPRTDHYIHLDFKEIQRGKEMSADVPVRFRGEAYGVRNEGGVLEAQLHEVGIRCRPRHLPESIEVDVTELRVGQAVFIRDLPQLEGVTYTSDADLAVVTVAGKSASVEVETPEEAEAEATA